MCLNRGNGVFSQRMFHHKVYDTGHRHKPLREQEEDLRKHFREDEEILPIILAIGSEI